MNDRRFFVKDSLDGDSISLGGEEYRHIAKVLRLRTGDSVVLCNGDGYDYFGEISSVTQSAAEIKLLRKEKNTAEPAKKIVLFQAMPKGEKADFIVQKSTELGLSGVVFFDSEFTVKKGSGEKTDRFSRIAAEAAKQCGRASVPEISAGVSFKETLKQLKNFDLQLFANERETAQSLRQTISQISITGFVALIVGSEGGFSEAEAKAFTENGAKSFSLGRRILRAETAAVAVAAIVACAAGELE